MKQITMFDQAQDAPLFSGTAIRTQTGQWFAPKPKPTQIGLFDIRCGLCFDTGLVGKDKERCICQK